ncbi:MAG TPA: ribokinase [Chthoniobacteraceae bacterium]|jgi:ribokinase|nr:ribokinase [Chthoniobacteraceae bacterium]
MHAKTAPAAIRVVVKTRASLVQPPHSSAESRPGVAVVGSLNLDLVASVPRLPGPGETVAATRLRKFFGGKGANQAIAAARGGAGVRMIGCLGGDADGALYRARLERFGIDTTGIATAAKSLTGAALIGVAASAENLIMVAPEANARLTPAWVRRQRRHIESAQALLLQCEVPLPGVLAAIRLANAAQVPVVLNPSPLDPAFPWGEVQVDYVIVNESEALAVFRLAPATLDSAPAKWRRKMRALGIGTLVVTRGGAPTRCLTADSVLAVPVPRVKPVDTVGAGDCFAGTFTAALARGEPLAAAILCANTAAALSTLQPGAQPSPPRHAWRSSGTDGSEK